MSEKPLEVHRLGNHVLHNGAPTPSDTHHANPSGNPGSDARADTLRHAPEKTQPDRITGSVAFAIEPYDMHAQTWLQRSDHYLENASPGCVIHVAAREAQPGLFGDLVAAGRRLGACLLGRPVARALPQDGSWLEVTRMYLVPGLPHGTASAMLRFAFAAAQRRGARTVIAYHDRTRHTGCIYRKAGMRRDGSTKPRASGWESRKRSRSASENGRTPKRRWRIDFCERDEA